MSQRPEKRVLAGPLDGQLSHKDVRDIFCLYAKVRYGGWYHHTTDPLETYCFLEFETEADAQKAIQCLTEGSLSAYGKSLRMVKLEAVGPLPLEMEEWDVWLSRGRTDERKTTDAGGKGKAKESSSLPKPFESADVDTKSPMYLVDVGTDDDKSKGKNPQGKDKDDDHADGNTDSTTCVRRPKKE